MATIPHEIVSEDDNGQRLDRWLGKRRADLGYAGLQKLIRKGQVRVDGKRAKPDQRLVSGQTVRMPVASENAGDDEIAPAPYALADISAMVIHEEQSLFILDKPKGLASQGGSGVQRHIDGLLPALARGKVVPRLVHRLDRDTSGLMLIARSASMARLLGRMLEHRQITKTYLAITHGVPPAPHGFIDAPLRKATGAEREKIIVDHEQGQSAQTQYRVLARSEGPTGGAALVAFRPLTGRTHQIRVHAAHMGCPLWGDVKYGAPDGQTGGFTLHAAALSFMHPETERPFAIRAPLPDDFQKQLAALGLVLPEDAPLLVSWGHAP